MSWQQYIDTQLLSKWTEAGWVRGCLESAAVLSKEDAAVWACSRNFKLMRYVLPVPDETDPESFTDIDVDECAGLLSLMVSWTPPPPTGIRISGVKYMSIGSDPERGVHYLRKSGGGGCLYRTRHTILFGSYSEELYTEGAANTRQSNQLCNERVEKFAGFLLAKGF